MSFEFIRALDHDALEKIDESGRARYVKRKAIKLGFQYQLSLYGILTNRETGENKYCRIEIMSNVPYTYEVVFLVYNWFKEFKATTSYSIWLYDDTKKGVLNVGRYR